VIALDTNVLRRYLDGIVARDTVIAARAVATEEAMLPPVVLTEALSDTAASDDHVRRTLSIALIPLYRGYWSRTGNLRRNLKLRGISAPTADCLIAQACIDIDIPLLTHDTGFTRFIDAGLKLL
jgi:predicted nucleic acid-binding protein